MVTSVGYTAEESINSPVKFIFNWETPSTLYKWGLAGTFALLLLCVRYFDFAERRLWAARGVLTPSELRKLAGVLALSYLFAVQGFTYIGPLKPSLITALLAAFVEENIVTARRRIRLRGSQQPAADVVLCLPEGVRNR